MKKSGFTKIALIVLSLTLILGAVIGISVSAEDTEKGIIAHNIVYGEKVAVAFAVNATLEEAESIKIAYYWEGEEENLKNATLLDTTVSENLYKKDGASYPVFVTSGLPAKELGKVAHATVYTGDAPAEDAVWETYSVAEYLFVRLYIDNFTAKTEADGLDYNRKLLYENLLNYGANAQMVFGHNTDKLITDYELAYTTNPLVTLNGANYAFGYDLTVEADYIGEGDIEKWTVTDTRGNESEAQSATISVDGVAKIDVVLGVHECADGDNDHVCDTCGEICSECVNNNATEDHLCDICGKVVDECTEGSVVDGLCDVCKSMNFEFSITTGVHLATGSAVLQQSFVKGETYTPATKSGFWGNIVSLTKRYENGREEVSNVLKIVVNDGSTKNTSLNTLGGSVYFTPAKVSDNGGNIHVIEFDYNWAQSAKSGWRNPFTLMAWDAEGNALGEVCNGNGKDDQYCVTALNNGNAFTEGTSANNAYQMGISGNQTEAAGGNYSLLNSDTWYRIRYVWDQSTGTVDIAASNDGGETWYKVAKQQTKKAYENADYLTISFTKPYGHGGIIYFDDIVYNVVSEMPEMPANNGIK